MRYWVGVIIIVIILISLPFLQSRGVFPLVPQAASHAPGVSPEQHSPNGTPISPPDNLDPVNQPEPYPPDDSDPVDQPEPYPPDLTPNDPDVVLMLAYLTFDDGPNSHFTGPILDILKEHSAVATFFVLGENAVLHPDLIERMLQEGHAVANHTYTHIYKKIYASPDALIQELDQCSQVLEPLTGHPVKVFRAPGGPQRLTAAMKTRLAAEGYTSISWNMTGRDSDPAGVTPEVMLETVTSDLDRVEQLGRTPILLLHDGTQLHTLEVNEGSAVARYIQNRESVITALPEIIKLFRARGYTFGTVDHNTPSAW